MNPIPRSIKPHIKSKATQITILAFGIIKARILHTIVVRLIPPMTT
jgi:hypothetical protein